MVGSDLYLCLLGFSIYLIGHAAVAREAIISGKQAAYDQFPYQISLWHSSETHSKAHLCGGGIISDLYILSAAHCVFGNHRQFRYKLENIIVMAETINVYRYGLSRSIRRIYIPKNYKPPTVLTSDIAVIKLMLPLELSKNPHLKALKLPSNKNLKEGGMRADIAGWGWYSIDTTNGQNITGRNDGYLRYAKADVLKPKQYREFYPARNISRRELVARTQHPDDLSKFSAVCIGDSGGPLVHDGTVIAILSQTSKNCSEPTAIYSRVSQYLVLIENALSNTVTNYMRTISQPGL